MAESAAGSSSLKRKHDLVRCNEQDADHSITDCKQAATCLTKSGSSALPRICRLAQVFAYQSGFTVLNEPLPSPAEVPPMTLLPSPVNSQQLEKVKKLGPVFSRLMDRVSCDVGWLMKHLAPLRLPDACDPWTAQLLDLAEEIYGKGAIAKDPKADAGRLFLMRQDYLPDRDGKYKQVEINTIAVAFAGLTEPLARVHGYLLGTCSAKLPESIRSAGEQMQDNAPGRAYAQALASAHLMYIKSTAQDCQARDRCSGPQVCFYCFPQDHLETDQRLIEVELRKLGVESFFAYLGADVELKGGDSARAGVGGTCIIDGIEASVVYFNCTYKPEHFANPKEWQNRKLMELSHAIKAPTLLGHLAGLKKVQEILSAKDALDRFLSPEEVEGCLSVFARQVDPSNTDSESIVAAAKCEPENWVLKPQREGGANNFFGEELKRLLCEGGSSLSQYVLMERIKSQPMPCLLMKKAGVVEQHDVCSELGLFSAYFASGDEEIHNNVGGAMLRTKAFSSAEGGVCAGHGVIDTPFVVS